MVSKSEFDAYEELAAEMGTTSLMEQREQEILPPKKTLMASVPGKLGDKGRFPILYKAIRKLLFQRLLDVFPQILGGHPGTPMLSFLFSLSDNTKEKVCKQYILYFIFLREQ